MKHTHNFPMPAITLWLLPYKQMILILYKNFRVKVPIIILIVTTSKASHNSNYIYTELSNTELGNKNDMDSISFYWTFLLELGILYNFDNFL